MASQAAVEIIIKARDDATNALDRIKGSLAGLSEHAGAATVVFGALAAAGTALIGSLTMTAARTEELGVVVANMGRVHGQTQDELESYEEALKAQGITTQAARDMMIRLMGSELDLADATKIARAAQDLAVISMTDSSAAAQELTYAIQSMQPRLLRKYGIYLNLNEVYEKAAKAQGIEAEQLSESAKRLAWKNAVLEKAAAYVGTYEAAMTSAGKQLRSMPRYIEEASNAIGQYFVPMLADAVGGLTSLLKGIIALPAPVKEGAAVLLGMSTAFAGTTAAIGGVVLILPKLVAALTFLAANPLVLVIAGVAALVAGLYALSKHMESTAQANEELNRAAVETSTTYAGYLRAVEDSTTGTTVLSEEVWKLVDAKIELQDATGEEAAALAIEGIERQKLLDTLMAYKQGSEEVVGVLAEYALNTSGISDAEAERARQLILQDAALREVAVAQGLLTQAEVDAVQAVESADRAMLSYATAIQGAREESGYYAEAMGKSAVAIRETEPPIEDMIAHLKELAQDPSVREHANQVRAMAQAVREAMRDSTIAYATFFTDIGESIEEHKAKLLEIEQTSAADLEAARTEYTDKIEALQAEYNQAETEEQREHLATKIAEENAAYADLETKQAEHLAAEKAKAEEAYADLQELQRQKLGEMLIQQIDTWARIDDTVAEHALEMKLAVAEEFGIITEDGRTMAQDMLGFMEEWRAGGAEKTDDMIAKFQEYMDKAQDATAATEDLGPAIDSIPDIDIRHNLQEVEDGANRARDAVKGIPSRKDVEVHFERTGWSGVQEMSPKTRIQHMLETLDAFLRSTDFTVNFGETGIEQISEAARQISALASAMSGLSALGEYEGIGEWSSVLTYYIPTLDAFKRDLKLVIEALGEIADELGPEVVDAADRVAEVTRGIGTALSAIIEGLAALAGYTSVGEWTFVAGYVIPQIDALKRDLIAVVNMLAETGADVAAAVPLAKAFAEDAADIMSNIQKAVEALNERQGLGAEPYSLIEMGKNLLVSLADGFVQAAQDEWGRISAALYKLVLDLYLYVDTVLGSVMEDAGSLLGLDFISGWIRGLYDNAGALYNAIADIVANAIAAAEAAAGVSSPSKRMIELGMNMGEGLNIGWRQAAGNWQPQLALAMPAGVGVGWQRAMRDVQRAIAADIGALGGGSAPLLQPVGSARTRGAEAAKTGWGSVAVYVNTLEPAPIARQVELTLRRLSLQAELSAGRG